MRTTIARAVTVAAVVTTAMLASSAGVAGADHGQPVVQACVGTTFSSAAAVLPPGDLGAAVAAFAQASETLHPGLGDGIRDLKAGVVPDDAVVNTCND